MKSRLVIVEHTVGKFTLAVDRESLWERTQSEIRYAVPYGRFIADLHSTYIQSTFETRLALEHNSDMFAKQAQIHNMDGLTFLTQIAFAEFVNEPAVITRCHAAIMSYSVEEKDAHQVYLDVMTFRCHFMIMNNLPCPQVPLNKLN